MAWFPSHRMASSLVLEPGWGAFTFPGSSPSSATSQVCGLRTVVSCSWASVFWSRKWDVCVESPTHWRNLIIIVVNISMSSTVGSMFSFAFWSGLLKYILHITKFAHFSYTIWWLLTITIYNHVTTITIMLWNITISPQKILWCPLQSIPSLRPPTP